MVDFTEQARNIMRKHDDNIYRSAGFCEDIAAAMAIAYQMGSADQLKRCENILIDQMVKAIRTHR